MSANPAGALAVAGYVEAVTATAVLGWAWLPGEPVKLPVELHLGEEIVSQAVADIARDDLAQGGIGDGRHAFSLPVPETARSRLAQLRVVARGPDGTATPLRSPPLEDGIAERLGQMTKGMEAIVNSLRLLHRNVQAVLLDAPTRTAPEQVELGVMEAISASQTALREDIATLELFVTRLEQSLTGVSPPSPRTAYPYWIIIGVAVVAVTALGMSIWAVVSTTAG